MASQCVSHRPPADYKIKAAVCIPDTSTAPYDLLKNAGMQYTFSKRNQKAIGVELATIDVQKGDEIATFTLHMLNPDWVVPGSSMNHILPELIKGAKLGLYLYDCDDPEGLSRFSSYHRLHTIVYPARTLYLLGVKACEGPDTTITKENARHAQEWFEQLGLASYGTFTLRDADVFEQVLADSFEAAL